MRPINWLSDLKSPPMVFAVDESSIQVMWGDLAPGPVSLCSANSSLTVEHSGGAGGLTLSGLDSGSFHTLILKSSGNETRLSARTLDPIGGQLLAKVATVSDLHMTADHWGYLRTMKETEPAGDPHPLRCARAAIAEAVAWGAEHLVIKGDAANHRSVESFEALGALVDEYPDMDMTLMRGNHDVDRHTKMDLPVSVGKRQLEYVNDAVRLDINGAAVISVNTTEEYRNSGAIASRIASTTSLIRAGEPTLVMLHHHLHQHRFLTYWPPGIAKTEALAFLNSLGKVSNRLLVSSGHTHRNSSRFYDGAKGQYPITQVASTKDWPGVWAGYSIYEGGIRQFVRRIESPSAANWNEFSRHALFGLWSKWSPGDLDQRCFNHTWGAT